MFNTIIEEQRKRLEAHENEGGNPPGVPGDGQGPDAPPQNQSAGVQGHEPPQALGSGAAPNTPPDVTPPPAPQAGSAEVDALKQQIAVLEGKVQEFQTLYNRQHGMVAPLQRKVAEQERTIQELNEKLNAAPNPGQATPNKPADTTTTPLSTDDPKLQEFMDLYGDMVPGLEAFLKAKLGAVAPPQNHPALEFAEQQRQQAERAQMLAAHLAPLYARYPKAAETLRSPQFQAWVEQQPSHTQEAILERVSHPENFPVSQIISIFDDYSRGGASTAQSSPSPGEMAVETRRVPTSATPGGKPEAQPLTRERLAFINRALTVDRSLYTPEQLASLRQEMEQGELASTSAGFGLAPRLDTLTR